ncbi:hypothetical protein PR202_gb23428 [Eleusine coracana subsp. coracana]|uniref:Uncharacterized protein n=1 Tax=Eleusine coracana subsp. coracana TaxID=191504 RepID=A0AAV5FJE5_ELECO|nr:hypothetical protein PR202_gb23428 [Eleusine coracana subsp. coracana]
MPRLALRQAERNFADWWRRAASKVKKEQKKRVNSLIILVAWILWKKRNACVFEGASLSVNLIMRAEG